MLIAKTSFQTVFSVGWRIYTNRGLLPIYSVTAYRVAHLFGYLRYPNRWRTR